MILSEFSGSLWWYYSFCPVHTKQKLEGHWHNCAFLEKLTKFGKSIIIMNDLFTRSSIFKKVRSVPYAYMRNAWLWKYPTINQTLVIRLPTFLIQFRVKVHKVILKFDLSMHPSNPLPILIDWISLKKFCLVTFIVIKTSAYACK